jgi:hypothetical protein
MTPSPAMIAREQLYALHKYMREIGPKASNELRLNVGLLAAQVEIANRLERIEQNLDAGLTVHGD